MKVSLNPAKTSPQYTATRELISPTSLSSQPSAIIRHQLKPANNNIIMSSSTASWYCPVCCKTFTNFTYFLKHHSYKSKIQCKVFYNSNHSTAPTGWYDPNNKSTPGTITGGNNPTVELPEQRQEQGDIAAASRPSSPDQGLDTLNEDVIMSNDEPLPPDDAPLPPDDDSSSEDISLDSSQNSVDEAYNPKASPYRVTLEQFTRYKHGGDNQYGPLPAAFRAGIELMSILDKEGAPISAYEKIMEWHVKNSVCPECNVTAHDKVTDKALLKRLRERYNMDDLKPRKVRTYLPHSRVYLDVPCHDAGAMLRDLLTDPRITDEDYLFFGDDPTTPPPADHEWEYLEDINTGLSYRETYKKVIKPNPITPSGRKKVLLPIIFYLDACVTGQFQNLSLEILKFTLGIFKAKSRDKGAFWRNLGAVPRYERAKKRSRQLLETSANLDARDCLTDSDSDYTALDTDDESGDGAKSGSRQQSTKFAPDFDYFPYIDFEGYPEDNDSNPDMEEDFMEFMEGIIPEIPKTNAQDFHCILHTILASYKEIQDSGGIDWDLLYKGKMWLLCLIPFIIFVKGDGVEHDKHCGKYGSRTEGVKQLCRYCCCPNEETDDPFALHERKSVPMIRGMVKNRDQKGLKNLSQKYLWNAWHELRFGSHNDLGIHGATPMEIIHWIQLGQFKYSREMLFHQTGEGNLGVELNVVATTLGPLLQRQSDRTLPRTKFSRGVMKGKLMAHEHTGVILVLAATLRCTSGRKVIEDFARTTKQKKNFAGQEWINDWVRMLELQLQFYAWLTSPSLKLHDVLKMDHKVRKYMHLVKNVGRRDVGMGFKTMNFHGTLHVPEDVQNFGVPANVNTMSDEMHHKDDKKSSKRTQYRPDKFEMQSLQQIENRRIIELGIEELNGRVRWRYDHAFVSKESLMWGDNVPKSAQVTPDEGKLSGVYACVRYNEATDKLQMSISSGIKRKYKYKYPPHVREEFNSILLELDGLTDDLSVHSEYTAPDDQMYRASPHFQGKAWHDWAMFGALPAHIRAFIDLSCLPPNNGTKFEPGIYALVETVGPNIEETNIHSDIFVPIIKQVHKDRPTELNLEVKPVGDITGPACVFPDLGHNSKLAYLRVKTVTDWAQLFVSFINEEDEEDD